MRPRLHPALPLVDRDEQTVQLGAHPRRAVVLTGLSRAARRWLGGLDGSRDLAGALREARSAGVPESSARALLDRLARSGVLDDAGGPAVPLPLAALDRMRPDLDAMDLAGSAAGAGRETLRRRAGSRVRVYGAGRVGAQVVALLAAAGVGRIRVFDPEPTRPRDLTPGGLTWAEVGMTREEGAAVVAGRLSPPGGVVSGPLPQPGRDVVGRATRPGGDAAGRPDQPDGSVAGQQGRPGSAASGQAPSGSAAAGRRAHSGGRTTGRQAQSGGGAAGRQAQFGDGDTAERTGQAGRAGLARPAEGARRAGTTGRTGQARPAEEARRAEAAGRVGRRGRAGGERVTVEVLAGGPYLGDGTDRPDLVILTPVRPLDMVLVNELTALGIPHLLGSAFEGHGFTGPLVIPGQTACLHCLDLTRRDHDPAWPIVTARLGGYPPGEIACDAALAASVAASVTGHALDYLDGHASAVMNGTTDISPDRHWKYRSWAIHAQCRCIRTNPYPLTMVMSATCE
ncbi:ThiF family adenylyltransferase [Nonomuraea sp. NPDC048826]|uniref:ThiF family adenylyltransferase n=1 Tax=Nonomuraea sp. NPDC048826 TaxID=3364347 RepID=UPI003718C28C